MPKYHSVSHGAFSAFVLRPLLLDSAHAFHRSRVTLVASYIIYKKRYVVISVAVTKIIFFFYS